MDGFEEIDAEYGNSTSENGQFVQLFMHFVEYRECKSTHRLPTIAGIVGLYFDCNTTLRTEIVSSIAPIHCHESTYVRFKDHVELVSGV